MNVSTHLGACLTAAVLAAAPSAQGPDASLLPSDTVMVAHFDVGAIARLLPFEDLLEEAAGGDADEVLAIMGMVERSLGFDPLEE